jgi:broad specificity phosphatase PhoE
MATLFFVRHGQASLFAAEYDELSERGRAQAHALGESLAGRGIRPTVVWTGPARRQRDTAAISAEAAHGLGVAWPDPLVVPGLDEHDAFGMVKNVLPRLRGDAEIEERERALVAASTPAERAGAFTHLFEAIMVRWLSGELDGSGVETWPSFRERVERGLEQIVASAEGRGARVFAFSSVGPLAVLLRRALQTSDLASFRTAWRCRNASVTSFVFSGPDRFTLDAFNDLSHLPDPAEHTFR